MYAVIETGGKQYRVELGSKVQVDRLPASPGETIRFDRVLLVADGDEATIGRPLVDGAVVTADVLGQDRGEKIVVFKYRPKARRRVKKGHRAELTTLRISDITVAGRSAAAEHDKLERQRARAAAAAEKEAAEKAAADQALAAKLAAARSTAETGSEPPRAGDETTKDE
jgi:large subunit ribosomal protein L21